MTIHCAIIDDEPLAAGLLKSYAEKTPFLHLVGTYGSALEAMKELREHPVQLLFLDIQMPELSGIEFAKVLPPETKIVFTTAFQQYAIEGYKVNALDYLLKPISYEDFMKAANKALDWFTVSQKQQIYAEDRFMFVKSDYKLVRVSLDDILYIEGLKDYVRIYLADGQKITRVSAHPPLLYRPHDQGPECRPFPHRLRRRVHPHLRLLQRGRTAVFQTTYAVVSEKFLHSALYFSLYFVTLQP